MCLLDDYHVSHNSIELRNVFKQLADCYKSTLCFKKQFVVVFLSQFVYVLSREVKRLINKSLGVNLFENIAPCLCLTDGKMACDL